VPGGEGRRRPLDDGHRRPTPPRDSVGDRREPPPERGHQPLRLLAGARVPADGADRGEDVVEAVRVQRDDLGGAAEIVERVLDVTGGQRADPAEILGQDQVGGQRGERVGVQRVEVLARGEL
jgi:hypothetical protein